MIRAGEVVCGCVALVDDAVDGTAPFFDAILMDVDNGPEGIVREVQRAGSIPAPAWPGCAGRLTVGGVLAVWSAAPDQALPGRLQQAGL